MQNYSQQSFEEPQASYPHVDHLSPEIHQQSGYAVPNQFNGQYPQQVSGGQQPGYAVPNQFNGQYSQQPVPGQNYYQPPIGGASPFMSGQPQVPVNVIVNVPQNNPNFALRVLWYIFIGWWVGFWWLTIGYLLCLSIVLLPVGLIMLNRLPTVLTLRPSSQQTTVSVSGSSVNVTVGGPQQASFLIRAIYFILVGWWAGGLWAYIGYFCCLTVLLIPVGLIMLNRLPLVLTLRQN